MSPESVLAIYQGAYNGAIKIGYLELFKKRTFKSQWEEKFVILSQIGLIVFSEPGLNEPELFVPIGGELTNVIRNPKGESVPYCLKILYQSSEIHYLLAAKSVADMDEWYDAIH